LFVETTALRPSRIKYALDWTHLLLNRYFNVTSLMLIYDFLCQENNALCCENLEDKCKVGWSQSIHLSHVKCSRPFCTAAGTVFLENSKTGGVCTELKKEEHVMLRLHCSRHCSSVQQACCNLMEQECLDARAAC